VGAPPAVVARRLAEPDVRGALWPGLTVSVSAERGAEGQRYLVDGPWRGTAELWLSACLDGVLVHAYLRVDPANPVRRPAVTRRDVERRMRRVLWRLKDELEIGRPPGVPVAGAPAR